MQPLYSIKHQILNSFDHGGVPQKRRRLYICGTLKSKIVKPFSFPAKLKGQPSLIDILDDKPADKHSARLPPASQIHCRKQVRELRRKLKKDGITKDKILKSMPVADIDDTVMTYQCNALPCITATRASNGGYWLEWQGRRTSLKELMRAQGMDPDRMQQVTSDRTLGHAIGNAMTQTVMQNILKKLLPAVGFAV